MVIIGAIAKLPHPNPKLALSLTLSVTISLDRYFCDNLYGLVYFAECGISNRFNLRNIRCTGEAYKEVSMQIVTLNTS